MFVSRNKDIIIPQSTHAEFAAAIAQFWGNENFDKPQINFDSFIKGVAFHDRGFGLLDNDGIFLMTPERHFEVLEKGFMQEFEDKQADLVAKMHIRRLTTYQESTLANSMREKFDQEIDQFIAKYDLDKTTFERTDRITDLCDSISFDFSFLQDKKDSIEIFAKRDSSTTTPIEYQIDCNTREILLSPWPFCVDSIKGQIIGFVANGYPDKLEPVIIPYSLRKG